MSVLLSKDKDGWFRDKDGVSYDSALDWFMTELGFCGCGSIEKIQKLAVGVLKHYGTPHDERVKNARWHPYNHIDCEILANVFHSKDLIEHGTGIGSGWLTDRGKDVLETLEKFKEQP